MRKCYQCNKEIKDILGKYYCSRECWEKYGENFKKITTKPTIKELQAKILELGKSAKKEKTESSIIEFAEKLFS